MRDYLFHLEPSNNESLQTQIREMLVTAILNGHIPPDSAVPSCRELARQLSVSRNTVVITYEKLVDDGFLYSRERSGYFASERFQPSLIRSATTPANPSTPSLNWKRRLRMRPSKQRNIAKPHDWRDYEYPFIYGQLDNRLFPFNEWRECCREANSRHAIRDWFSDSIDGDEPALIEQLHSRLLPGRGVWARPEEILVTLGTQNSLYLISQLLIAPGTVVGIEDPGYVDARNILETAGARLVPIPIDDEGIIVDERLDACDLVFVTPSHQSPTTVTMSLDRRRALLEKAESADFVIIEDDYDSEINFDKNPIPALKSLDTHQRVAYMSSLSKTLAPGLRLGYLVAPEQLIEEARSLRRLMLRHPPSNNQQSVALFLARGYHDTVVHRLTRIYRERWHILADALDRYLPGVGRPSTYGGSSFWLSLPPGMDSATITRQAAAASILIEPGDVHFMAPNPPRRYLRTGFAAIDQARIEEGIRRLGTIMHGCRAA